MTWLYVPTSSASAPEAEGSISESDWRCQMLAQSVTWNEKLSPSRSWSRRLKLVSWTRLLYGAISRPSTANRGVESWIGSLAESRANRTPELASVSVRKTTGISGQPLNESSKTFDPASSSWTTFQASQGITSTESGLPYKDWVTQLRRDYSQRQKSAIPRFARDSSFWVGPVASWESGSQRGTWNGKHYIREDGSKATSVLFHQAANWWNAVTTAPEASNQGSHRMNGPKSLLGQAQQVTMFWPPATVDGNHNRRGASTTSGDGLATLASMWPAVTTSDNDAVHYGNESLRLSGAAMSFPPVRSNSTNGHECSSKCRRLNPLFVEMLMGWPGGWTLLPIGLRDIESSAMAWYRWSELMRSALSRLERG